MDISATHGESRTLSPSPLPRRRRRAIRVLAVALVSFAASAAPAAANVDLDGWGGVYVNPVEPDNIHDQPEDMRCQPGDEWAVTPSASAEHKLTHATAYELFTGGKGRYSLSASHRTTISAGYTGSLQTEAQVGKVFASLKATTTHEVRANGERTSERTEEVVADLPGNDVYVFFRGTTEYRGTWNLYRCTSNQEVELKASGEVHSWEIERSGAVGCSIDPPAGSMAAKAKAQYCSEGDATAYAKFLIATTPRVEVRMH